MTPEQRFTDAAITFARCNYEYRVAEQQITKIIVRRRATIEAAEAQGVKDLKVARAHRNKTKEVQIAAERAYAEARAMMPWPEAKKC